MLSTLFREQEKAEANKGKGTEENPHSQNHPGK
jgi:hypothetical protein